VGFVADHIEVVWDLDTELAEQAAEARIALARASTPNSSPGFARLAVDLMDELQRGLPAARADGPDPVPGYGCTVNGALCTPACSSS
jgi:ferrochelatase